MVLLVVFFTCHLGFPVGSDGKESTCNTGDTDSICRSVRVPWRREYLCIPVFMPGEFHGRRSLVGYSSQARKGLDPTEGLTLICFLVSFIWDSMSSTPLSPLTWTQRCYSSEQKCKFLCMSCNVFKHLSSIDTLIIPPCAVLCLVTQSFPTLCHPMDCSLPGSSVQARTPGHAFLQETFPIPGLNPDFPHCRQILWATRESLTIPNLVKLFNIIPPLYTFSYVFF